MIVPRVFKSRQRKRKNISIVLSSHHRNIADRCAEGGLILDPQSVLLDFLCPISLGKQGHILSGVKQIPCQIAP